MDGLRALISSSKNVLNAKYYEEFVINTIKTCGYNSDTYTLFNNLKNNINPTKYKKDLLNIKMFFCTRHCILYLL